MATLALNLRSSKTLQPYGFFFFFLLLVSVGHSLRSSNPPLGSPHSSSNTGCASLFFFLIELTRGPERAKATKMFSSLIKNAKVS